MSIGKVKEIAIFVASVAAAYGAMYYMQKKQGWKVPVVGPYLPGGH